MAADKNAPRPDSSTAPEPSGTIGQDGQPDGGTQGGTPGEIIPPSPGRGRPRTNHGRIAENRRAADERYAAKKSGRAPSPEAQKQAVKPTSAGYANTIVAAHDQAADALSMPELRITLSTAQKLESAVSDVMADRGVVMQTPRAHMMTLVSLVAIIYGPILLALVRRYMAWRKAMDEPPAPTVQRAPTKHVQTGVETINTEGGKPESDWQIFGNGQAIAGAFMPMPGQAAGAVA